MSPVDLGVETHNQAKDARKIKPAVATEKLTLWSDSAYPRSGRRIGDRGVTLLLLAKELRL